MIFDMEAYRGEKLAAFHLKTGFYKAHRSINKVPSGKV